MKAQFRSNFLIAITWSCFAASAPTASAETLSFSGTGTVRMLATDWAAYIGGSGNFKEGFPEPLGMAAGATVAVGVGCTATTGAGCVKAR